MRFFQWTLPAALLRNNFKNFDIKLKHAMCVIGRVYTPGKILILTRWANLMLLSTGARHRKFCGVYTTLA